MQCVRRVRWRGTEVVLQCGGPLPFAPELAVQVQHHAVANPGTYNRGNGHGGSPRYRTSGPGDPGKRVVRTSTCPFEGERFDRQRQDTIVLQLLLAEMRMHSTESFF